MKKVKREEIAESVLRRESMKDQDDGLCGEGGITVGTGEDGACYEAFTTSPATSLVRQRGRGPSRRDRNRACARGRKALNKGKVQSDNRRNSAAR